MKNGGVSDRGDITNPMDMLMLHIESDCGSRIQRKQGGIILSDAASIILEGTAKPAVGERLQQSNPAVNPGQMCQLVPQWHSCWASRPPLSDGITGLFCRKDYKTGTVSLIKKTLAYFCYVLF